MGADNEAIGPKMHDNNLKTSSLKKVEELQRFAEEVANASQSMSTAYLLIKFDNNREDDKLAWDKIIQSYRRAKAELESTSN